MFTECRSQGDERSPSTAGAAAPRDRKTWEDPEIAQASHENRGIHHQVTAISWGKYGKIRFQDAAIQVNCGDSRLKVEINLPRG
jgi:hypothetical protein